MIEREFIKNKLNELNMKKRIEKEISPRAGIGGITFEKTPLGEKVVIDAVKPGLVIGRAGETIKNLTYELKSRFKLENPQIEVREITNPNLNAQVVARSIVFELESFGIRRFKPLAYRSLTRIMRSGALGCEIKISGKVPSQRARTWRFFDGYMKKCGDVAQNYVDSVIMVANTRSGAVGIKVSIMLPGTPLPDRVEFKKIFVEEQTPAGEVVSVQEVGVEQAEAEIKKSEDEKEILPAEPSLKRAAKSSPNAESKSTSAEKPKTELNPTENVKKEAKPKKEKIEEKMEAKK